MADCLIGKPKPSHWSTTALLASSCRFLVQVFEAYNKAIRPTKIDFDGVIVSEYLI